MHIRGLHGNGDGGDSAGMGTWNFELQESCGDGIRLCGNLTGLLTCFGNLADDKNSSASGVYVPGFYLGKFYRLQAWRLQNHNEVWEVCLQLGTG